MGYSRWQISESSWCSSYCESSCNDILDGSRRVPTNCVTQCEYNRAGGMASYINTHMVSAIHLLKILFTRGVASTIRIGYHHGSLRRFVEDAQLLLRSNKFVSDYDAIAMTMPYSSGRQADIQRIWIHWWEHDKEEYQQVFIPCWGNEWPSCIMPMHSRHDTLWIISKQRVSMQKGTRKRRKKQERWAFSPKGLPCAACCWYWRPDEQKHGHKLDILTHLKDSYCMTCAAGYGRCIHIAMALWIQYHHWGPGRPIERFPPWIFVDGFK